MAAANTAVSENWSGYAAHRSGTHFRRVSASWRQPTGTCTSGETTYSAFWVGLGGFNLSSDALEQIGSELDCDSSGTETLSAWYELVPAASHAIKMTLHSGDLIRASVTVVNKRVTLALSDVNRHESFGKTITDHEIDISSAEWIAEAPSECSSANDCQTLPLTDFGNVAFSGASAENASGHTGSISSSRWSTTRIVLATTGTRFISTTNSVAATPTALTGGGRAFSVDYSGSSSSGAGGVSSSASSAETAGRIPTATRSASVARHHGAVERVGARAG
jgi:hypothetical protein